jgi:hypothetical protein
MSTPARARTYNQSHITRPHTGGRRISIYWTWSYPWESQRDPAEMYNRFSTMTEVRNVLWPSYETPEYDAANFLQGIAGTLELFHRFTLAFQELAEEATGHPVAVFQRIDQAGVICGENFLYWYPDAGVPLHQARYRTAHNRGRASGQRHRGPGLMLRRP